MNVKTIVTILTLLSLLNGCKAAKQKTKLVYEVPDGLTCPINGSSLPTGELEVRLIGSDGTESVYYFPSTKNVPINRLFTGSIEVILHAPVWGGTSGDQSCPDIPDGSTLACWLYMGYERAAAINPLTGNPLELKIYYRVSGGEWTEQIQDDPDNWWAAIKRNVSDQEIKIVFSIAASDWK